MNENCTQCLVPQELIHEILLRLPVKSLVRFKCVRKSWLSLISNPEFTQLHFDLAAAPSHRLLLKPSGDHIESIDTDATLGDDSARLYLRFPPPPPPNLRSPPCLQVFGSCRGFLLLNHEKHELNNFVVWNPSTGFHRRIPDPDSDPDMDEHFLCGFGYDSSKDDYLVILIISDDVHIPSPQPDQPGMIKLFSLKTNSWDCISIIRYFDSPCEGRCSNMPGSFLNGALHWLVFSRDTHSVVILAFDLVERRLYEIPLPHVLNDNPKYYPCDLRVIGGCLGVWCINLEMDTMGEMWMMKEYGVLSSWSRYFRFRDDGPFVDFSPICLTQDNALLGSDLGCHRLKKLCGETGQCLSEHFSNRKLGDFYFFKLPCALYRESLLSLPTDS